MDANSPQYHRTADSVILPTLALLSLILSVPPLLWHWRNKNIAACSLIFWISLANAFVFINALIWPTDDVANWWDGQGLCDIEVKLTWAFSIGASGALCCIMRNLAKVMDVNRVRPNTSRAQRRRAVVVDLLWCFAIPVYSIGVDYIVQQNRYYIFTISGCTPSINSSWLSIILVFIWAPILSVVNSFYCVMVIIRLYTYRQQFSTIINSSSSGLNRSRFLRLFFLALTLIVVFLPLQFYIFHVNLSYPRHPYDWSVVHGPSWGDIIKVPTGGQAAFDRWLRVASGLLIFVFFGLGRDAVTMYRGWLMAAGLGKVFPSLTASRRPETTMSGSGNSSKLHLLGSRAKGLFRKGTRTDSQITMATTCTPPGTRTSISVSTPRLDSSPLHPQTAFSDAGNERSHRSLDLERRTSTSGSSPAASEYHRSTAEHAHEATIMEPPRTHAMHPRIPTVVRSMEQIQVRTSAWSAGRSRHVRDLEHVGGRVNVKTELEVQHTN